MRVNKTKTHHDINSLDKAKIFKLFRVSFFSFCLIATLVSITQSFSKVSAVENSSSANASVTVSSACSFNVSRSSGYDNVSETYTGTLSNGSDTEIIGSTFKTICNDPGGYAIYAIGYSNSTLGNTDLIFNDTPESTNNIKTNGDTLVGGNGSYWKMKLSPVSGTFAPTIDNGYDSYNVIPSNYTKVASFNNVTVNSSDSTTGSSIATSYLAYASSTQPAGTYTGAVKYTMVHPGTMVAGNYTIVYNSNGGTGTMQSETNIPNYESHTLANNTFTAPSGYAFAGWCTVQDTTASGVVQGADPQTTCTSTSYANGATLPDSPSTAATANGTLNLYAYWRIPKTITDTVYMQDVEACPASLAVGTTATLKDKRDEQNYTVAKLADGKCWMTKNLNLAGNILLSSDTTDFDSSYTLPTSDGWQDDGKLPASNTSGFSNNGYAYVYNSNETCNNTPCYSYYSWDAATVGSGKSISSGNTDAPYSICPKGWRLPTSRSISANNWQTDSDFYTLAHQYGLDSTTSNEGGGGFYTQAGPGTTPNFLRAGFYSDSSRTLNSGRYWSSTKDSGSYAAKNLAFTTSYTGSADVSPTRYGYSIRCLVK